MSPRVLVLDNFDSFVYNLVQYLGELGAQPIVYRANERSTSQLLEEQFDAILLSPGPGHPKDATQSLELIEASLDVYPLLGVCLGHQCLGHYFGATIAQAPTIMHGKTSLVNHSSEGVFTGLPNPLEVTRYHSLVIHPQDLPQTLQITGATDDGTIMGVRHNEFNLEGVQFHPESILTTAGHQLIQNFLKQI